MKHLTQTDYDILSAILAGVIRRHEKGLRHLTLAHPYYEEKKQKIEMRIAKYRDLLKRLREHVN